MKVLNIVLVFGLLIAAAAQADTCKKGGKDLAVAGKNDAEKKAACAKAGGAWTKDTKKNALGNGIGNGK